MKHLTNLIDTAKDIGKNTLAIAKKPIFYLSLLAALAAPLKSQGIPDDFPPEINRGDMENPHKQPNDRSLHWYGSGDANDDGIITLSGDVSAMQSGAQNDMADVDGDGIPSTPQDIITLQDYFNGNISYLPGWWNRLQTRAEKESWLEKMLAIDQTDTNTWIDGTIDERFISGNFATQLVLNFYGFDKQNIDDNDIPVKYDTTNMGRFNIPVYRVSVGHNTTNWGHGMNVVIVEGDPRNFYNLCFVEPQNDSINVTPPVWNMPYNSQYRIQAMWSFNSTGSPDMPIPYLIEGFNIDEIGADSIYYGPVEGLILERPDWISDFPEGLPTVGVDTRGFTGPTGFELYQNYPNPFNSATKIKYNLPIRGFVNLNIYNLKGEKIRTLIDSDQNPGIHEIGFNASNHPSGIYLYRLQAGKHSNTKKMTIIK